LAHHTLLSDSRTFGMMPRLGPGNAKSANHFVFSDATRFKFKTTRSS